jgi:hypothetical protein
MLEHPVSRLEAASVCCFEREPNPVEYYEHVEYHDCETEIPSENLLIYDIGGHCKKPQRVVRNVDPKRK